jgi:hypothetical protein
MRKELYSAISARLLATDVIKYVDLWNRNVEFIEQESNWARPAVFVEFDPIVWDRTKERAMRTVSTLKLHIVTDWYGSASSEAGATEEALEEMFGLTKLVRQAIEGMAGKTFSRLMLAQSYTNHDHEEILESIDVYSYRGLVFF